MQLKKYTPAMQYTNISNLGPGGQYAEMSIREKLTPPQFLSKEKRNSEELQ